MSGKKTSPAPLPRSLFLSLMLAAAAMLAAGFLSRPSATMAPETNLFEIESVSTEPVQAKLVHLLLIGQDARQNGEASRSDTMILCSFRPGSGKVTLISFLRDLYVRIPGHASNRLNAAYAFGGAELLKQTFEENFGVTIDGCIEVNFQQFTRLVDLMGGTELELRGDEAALLSQLPDSGKLTEGLQHLDGQQALAYVRIRNLDADGDFSRTLRQRKLLCALLDGLQQCSPGKLLSLLSGIDSLVSTDLPIPQLAAYAASVWPLLKDSQAVLLRVPADGTYSPKTVDGMAVLMADPDMIRDFLAAALGDT